MARPGLTHRGRLIATARAHAHRETWPRLIPLPSLERQASLDAPLTPDAETDRTSLSRLRQAATAGTQAHLVLRPSVC